MAIALTTSRWVAVFYLFLAAALRSCLALQSFHALGLPPGEPPEGSAEGFWYRGRHPFVSVLQQHQQQQLSGRRGGPTAQKPEDRPIRTVDPNTKSKALGLASAVASAVSHAVDWGVGLAEDLLASNSSLQQKDVSVSNSSARHKDLLAYNSSMQQEDVSVSNSSMQQQDLLASNSSLQQEDMLISNISSQQKGESAQPFVTLVPIQNASKKDKEEPTQATQPFVRLVPVQNASKRKDRDTRPLQGELVVRTADNEVQEIVPVIINAEEQEITLSNNTFSIKEESAEPFVKLVHAPEFTEVQIASPNSIMSIYLLMFVPIGMAWAAVLHNGSSEKHYLIILPVTLCSMIIGLDLVNQSLSVLMKSPMALTSIQAFSMVVATGIWAVVDELRNPKFTGKMLWPLARWSLVAVLFSVYQVVNHLVSYYCSLSERTVFMNMCPLVSLVLELTVLSKRVNMQITFNGKMALCGMAFGAVLFALQYPRFTFDGTMAAMALVVFVIPYRLLQRWLLVDCLELPLPILACYDGIFLLAPTSLLTVLNQDQFWVSMNTWFSSPAIMLMLGLSWVTFIGNHVCNLMLLRVTSATATLVFTNLANFVVVFEGVIFFGDKVTQNPMVLIGILVSLSSGVWYAVEMQPSSLECCKPSVPAMKRIESKEQGVGDCSVFDEDERADA